MLPSFFGLAMGSFVAPFAPIGAGIAKGPLSLILLPRSYAAQPVRRRTVTNAAAINEGIIDVDEKERLMGLLSTVPANAPTSPELTAEILSAVTDLEARCPTEDEEVLGKLVGNWELMWTAQDKNSEEWKQGLLRRWINPLENQAYSNNPSGRANPILPREIQDKLEEMGVLSSVEGPGASSSGGDGDDSSPGSGNDDDGSPSSPVRSSQLIDPKRRRVRNVVSVGLPSLGPLFLLGGGTKTRRGGTNVGGGGGGGGGGGASEARGSLTVDVAYRPSSVDPRRIDVKFESCRVVMRGGIAPRLDVTIPLGLIGPTGWLRTGYVDDDIRITRGHKGSVFILSRTSSAVQGPNNA